MINLRHGAGNNHELYNSLRDKLGKEEGRRVAEAINIGLDVIEKKADAVAISEKAGNQRGINKGTCFAKVDILVLREEFFETKSIRHERCKQFVQEMADTPSGNADHKTELEGKIERLNQKFNFMIILLVLALTLMNPVAAEIIKNLLNYKRRLPRPDFIGTRNDR